VVAMSMMETWVLMFYLVATPAFVGGEYQSEELCALSARHQTPHWKQQRRYRLGLSWKCELRPDEVATAAAVAS
jgi:hypothetical protein